jgi:hypothetical protein
MVLENKKTADVESLDSKTKSAGLKLKSTKFKNISLPQGRRTSVDAQKASDLIRSEFKELLAK